MSTLQGPGISICLGTNHRGYTVRRCRLATEFAERSKPQAIADMPRNC